jgi:hypothetical protein
VLPPIGQGSPDGRRWDEYAVKSENLSIELYSKLYDGTSYDKAKQVLKMLIEEEKLMQKF